MERRYNGKMIRKKNEVPENIPGETSLEEKKQKITFNITCYPEFQKSLKDYLVRAALPKTNETGRCEPCGKKTCLVCNSIRTTTTFTAGACGENFKSHRFLLTCYSEKVLYLLKYKVCDEKLKLSFDIGS